MTKTPARGSYLQVNTGSSLVTIPGLESIPEFGPEKSFYDNTAIDDTARTFGVDLPDPGEMTITGSFDATNVAHNYIWQTANNASITTTTPFSATFKSTAVYTFAAYILSCKVSGAGGADEKFTARLKLSGAPSRTTPA